MTAVRYTNLRSLLGRQISTQRRTVVYYHKLCSLVTQVNLALSPPRSMENLTAAVQPFA